VKKIILGLATAALAILTTSLVAQAADLPQRPAPAPAPVMMPYMYDWTGFYVGANGGYGTSRNCWGIVQTGVGTVPDGCHNQSGGVIGGQGGYRWQFGSVVFGVEAEGDWASMRSSHQSIFNPLLTDSSKVTSVGLFTGELGYAMNNALFYLKGGGALTNNNLLIQQTSTGVGLAYLTTHKLGATVGVGLEYGFTPNWSAGIEYDHLMMGNANNSFSCSAICASVVNNISQNVEMVTIRVNYKFGGPVTARY
jgi:outer membrane immunogenic protein